jgi:hypothetical protein
MLLMLDRMNESSDIALRAQREAFNKPVDAHAFRFFEGSRTRERLQVSCDIEVRLRWVKPRIWRRLRVPAHMSLHALADRVLLPALGVARGLHGY